MALGTQDKRIGIFYRGGIGNKKLRVPPCNSAVSLLFVKFYRVFMAFILGVAKRRPRDNQTAKRFWFAQGIEAVSFFACGKKDTSGKPGPATQVAGCAQNQNGAWHFTRFPENGIL
jgi:hypothetical protein